jgi:hypothetical protein
MYFLDISSLGVSYQYVVKIKQKFRHQKKWEFGSANMQQPKYEEDSANMHQYRYQILQMKSGSKIP